MPEVTIERHSATSADGTKVPYFLLRPAGAGSAQPTLLYGYGGFNIAMTPTFSAAWARLARAGGALRGREPARRRRVRRGLARGRHAGAKQNVFDDFIAGGRIPRLERGHHPRRSWRSRAAATAACWSAR